MVKNILAVLVLGSAGALAVSAKGNLVFPLLSATLMFAAAVLPFFAEATIKFVV